MKKLFFDTRELDQRAIELGFDSEILMENAAAAIAKQVRKKIKKGKLIAGILGSGNNGGDVATALRMLSGDYECVAFITTKKQNSMLIKQLDLAKKCGVKIILDFNIIKAAKCIIDGILGTGLNKDLDNFMIDLINRLNSIKALKIACDLPSGLDSSGMVRGVCFKADYTITMGAAKISLYSDFAKDFVGKVKVANLGLNNKFYEIESQYFKLTKSDLTLPFRTKQNTNKGNFGHVFVVSGKFSGAARLSALAALNIGAGLVSVVNGKDLEPVLMQSNNISQNMKFGAVGMGLGELNLEQKNKLFEILSTKSGLVLDADLCYESQTIKLLNQNTIITPHPKEFASLLALAGFGDFSIETVQKNRFELAREWSLKFKSVLVLKGANTIIAQNGEIFIMPFGSPKLAKGGNGDVLSGIIIGLLAQNYSPIKAAINGCLAHALVAKKSKKNDFAFSPTDIIKGLQWLKG